MSNADLRSKFALGIGSNIGYTSKVTVPLKLATTFNDILA